MYAVDAKIDQMDLLPFLQDNCSYGFSVSLDADGCLESPISNLITLVYDGLFRDWIAQNCSGRATVAQCIRIPEPHGPCFLTIHFTEQQDAALFKVFFG